VRPLREPHRASESPFVLTSERGEPVSASGFRKQLSRWGDANAGTSSVSIALGAIDALLTDTDELDNPFAMDLSLAGLTMNIAMSNGGESLNITNVGIGNQPLILLVDDQEALNFAVDTLSWTLDGATKRFTFTQPLDLSMSIHNHQGVLGGFIGLVDLFGIFSTLPTPDDPDNQGTLSATAPTGTTFEVVPVTDVECRNILKVSSGGPFETIGTVYFAGSITVNAGECFAKNTDPLTAFPFELVECTTASTAPTASFTATPTSGTAPLTVNFDASASTDSDGSIASYSWNFGDGGSGSGVTTSHTYTSDGTYTVTLTVTDDDGASDTATQTITVGSGGTIAEVEPNDLPAQAQALTPAVTVTGNVVYPGTDDFDVFRITPAADTTLTVTLSGFGAGDLDLYGTDDAQLLTEWINDTWDGTIPPTAEIYGSDVDAPWEGPTEFFTYTFTGGKTYYIVVEAWDTGGVVTDYSLDIQ